MENTHQVQSKLALARSAKKEAERKMEENAAKNAQIVVDLKAKLFESEQHYKNQTKLNAEVKEEQRQMIQQLSTLQTKSNQLEEQLTQSE